MSADNYYVIVRHPNGGFTPIMRFMSNEYENEPQAEDWMESFPTVWEAQSWALKEYTEYGVDIHYSCWDHDIKCIMLTEKERELLQVMCRNAQDEGYFQYLFKEELESIIEKLGD